MGNSARIAFVVVVFISGSLFWFTDRSDHVTQHFPSNDAGNPWVTVLDKKGQTMSCVSYATGRLAMVCETVEPKPGKEQ